MAELLLREMLTNAVCHGCEQDHRRQVRCHARLTPGTLALAVEDDGQGFDWRAALARSPDATESSGRGLSILRLHATDLQFNEAGNRVDLVRILKTAEEPMMDSSIVHRETKAVLQAGGDLVSTTVPGLRPILRELLQEGIRELVLDLGQTTMVDSSGIGLLIAAHNSLAKAGGTLTVVHASPEIRELLTSIRLNQHFTVEDD